MSSPAAVEPRSGQRTSCVLCGRDDAWRIYLAGVLDYLTDERFDIDCCAGCGLMVTRPMPGEAEIERYYPPRYRGNRHGFTGGMRVALRRREVESCFARGFRGRLLDVGCGDGSFALEMRSRGWEVGVTEIDAETVERLRSQGIDAKAPRLAEEEGFERPFDVVTCWHVLEHVEEPLRVAQWVKTQLKPEGVFQATVPNAGCVQARLFGRHWLHLDVPRHRYHFTPSTFKSILQRAGFEQLRKTVFAWEYDWFGIIQSALNGVCTRPNGLFERLMGASAGGSARSRSMRKDEWISFVLAPPLAGLSLLPMLAAWGLGNGATLTLTCRWWPPT